MKVLLSAIACNPDGISESYFGWSAVQCLAQDHELLVITSHRNRPDLEKAEAEGKVPKNVRFFYAGRCEPWHPNRLRARLQGWNEYVRFSKDVFIVARRVKETIGFELAHHVTYSTWRVASPLWRLDVPFVFGPVGGNEQFPARFLSILSPSAIAFETLRVASNFASALSPAVRSCIRGAAHVLVSNAETEALIIRLRKSKNGISRLVPNFHSNDRANEFADYAGSKTTDGILRLFSGGNLEGRKGVALSLHALARAKARGVKFRYRIGGKGPEFQSLQRTTSSLGLQDEICFGEPLKGVDYRRELGATHICLLPSLRDSAPITLAEAMLAHCVPIVADCGGPGLMVNEECGYKLAVSSPARFVDDLTEVIVTADRNRKLLRTKGEAAANRIRTFFTAENYRNVINATYARVLEQRHP